MIKRSPQRMELEAANIGVLAKPDTSTSSNVIRLFFTFSILLIYTEFKLNVIELFDLNSISNPYTG